ncbi:response regulator transcription factor [Bifidobacterium samirii]|uniref:Two-component response regulator n=1 Tax=Bifidobacterium samirii TaxID=2306974 RepID=A0A430FR51_9BIFI|nr:response regulator [Bifidobacterium samirii]RSX55295.1 two-component response regulator [Bifidobacterium samirii]
MTKPNEGERPAVEEKPAAEEKPATPLTVAAVDNDRMATIALQGILPQLLPGARWLWSAATADEAVRTALAPDTRPDLLLVDMSLGESTGISVCRRIRSRTNRVPMLAITAFSVDTYADRAATAGAQGIVSKADIPLLARALRTIAAGRTFDPDVADGDDAGGANADDAASSARHRSSARPASACAAGRFQTAFDAHRRIAYGERPATTVPSSGAPMPSAAAVTEAITAGSGGRSIGATTGNGATTASPSSDARRGSATTHPTAASSAPASPSADLPPRLGAKEAQTLHLLSRGMTYEQIAAQWGVAASTVRTHAHRAVEKLGAHSLAHAVAIWLSR